MLGLTTSALAVGCDAFSAFSAFSA
jgi:hypothetical protein